MGAHDSRKKSNMEPSPRHRCTKHRCPGEKAHPFRFVVPKKEKRKLLEARETPATALRSFSEQRKQLIRLPN